jgi:cell shape-determining protein MreC|tara:strand:+ start:2011 stop:2148 length:138 start_codon:yes stop_codon:yes gene_type:complete
MQKAKLQESTKEIIKEIIDLKSVKPQTQELKKKIQKLQQRLEDVS